MQHRFLFILQLLLVCFFGNAQPGIDSSMTATLEEVILTGRRPWVYRPVSAQTDTLGNLETYQPGLRNAFLQIPGVIAFNGENFAQDMRLSIRGFGSRAAFGIRGVRVWMDGIPLTSPDGTTQLDELSLWDVQTTSFLRSGTSARYGNAAGGGLMFTTPASFRGAQLRAAWSPLGAWSAGARVGYSSGNAHHLTSVNHHYFEGRREFAESRNMTLYHKTRFWLTPNWQFMCLAGAYHSPLGRDPGALTASEFATDPFQANARNLQYQAGEAVSGGMAAVNSRYAVTKKLTWVSAIYYRKRMFEARLPFLNGGWVQLDRDFAGWQNTLELAIHPGWNLSGGTSMEWQQDHRRLSQNKEGVKGALSADQYERLLNAGIWLQNELTLGRFKLQQLARADLNRFRLTDQFPEDGIQQGKKQLRTAGFSVTAETVLPASIRAFTGVSTGFETPTLQELTNNPESGSGLNASLQAEKYWQVEAGLKKHSDNGFSWSASVFYIRLRDAITGYELPQTPGRTYFRNASRADRLGGEGSITYAWNAHTLLEASYTISRFRWLDFPVGSINYAGNSQSLIPVHRAALRAQCHITKFAEASMQWLWQSAMFADDANQVTIPTSFECHAQLSTTDALFASFRLGISGSNILGTAPYSNIRANAAAMRYYEAATPWLVSLLGQWSLNRE